MLRVSPRLHSAAIAGPMGPFYASDLQSAYNYFSAKTVRGGGAGQVVAIIDVQYIPNLVSDLATYRHLMNLSTCPAGTVSHSNTSCVIQQVAQPSSPPGAPMPAQTDRGWIEEASLDVDMVSALCPKCQILFVEARTANLADLGTAVDMAVADGANAVSNSYGGPEWSTEAADAGAFYNHPGVAVVAASGDCGYNPDTNSPSVDPCGGQGGAQYPAADPAVVAVGGTSLVQNSPGPRNGWIETAWNGAGAGCSAYEPKPVWQTDPSCGTRMISDVSAVADPNTGVLVYDSAISTTDYLIMGGTSAASPLIAAMYALAGNPASLPVTATASLYAAPGSLVPVTSGSDGICGGLYLCDASASVNGYNGPTGLGTPGATPNSIPAFTFAPAISPAGTPSVIGRATAGTTLSLSTGTWDTGVSFSYQWLRDGSPILGATSATYLVVSADASHGISVAVTGTKAGFSPVTMTSAPVPDIGGATALPYVPLTPARICDTRPTGAGVLSNQCDNSTGISTLGAGTVATVQVNGLGGVPSSASAVVVNVTVTNATAASYLTLYPGGGVRPTASNLNWTRGTTIANLVEVPLSGTGSVAVYNAVGSVDVIIDVEGYVGATDPSGTALGAGTGLYTPMTPARLCDTRPVSGTIVANQCNVNASKLGTKATLNVQVTNRAGIPAGVAAVALNVTVTGTTAPSFLTAWPDGVSRPTASNLNWVGGQTIANRVVVPVGADGAIDVFNAAGSTNVIIDVAGWYSDASNPSATGSLYVPLTPTRICDTRLVVGTVSPNQCNAFNATSGKLGPTTSMAVVVGGYGAGIPAGATGAVLNVTVTGTTAVSYLSVWPSDQAQPNASDLNWSAGVTIPNLVIAALSKDGFISLYNSAGSAQAIVDAEGYFVPA